MSPESSIQEPANLSVTNIGGIDNTTVNLPPEVTVLSGRNATNRTSLLQAILAACGSDDATLKSDADEGSIELTIKDDTYTRELTRMSGSNSVTFSGDPYLTDPTGADLFAFLLENNEARRAVERDDNLRDIIMRPVDMEAIQADIDRLEAEKHNLEQELNTLDNLEQRLPQLEENRTQLKEDIDAKRDELTTKEDELDATDVTVEETREEQADLDAKLDELRETRSRLEDIRYDVETHQESIERLREERQDLQDDYDELSEPTDEDLETLTSELDRLRNRKSNLETDLNDLQRLINFNEDIFEDADTPDIEALDEDEDRDADGAVTDQLLADKNDTVTCWTCGTTVDRGQIEGTIDRLQELRQQKLSAVNDLEDDIDEIQNERQEIHEIQQRREELDQRLSEVADEIAERETTLEDLQTEREELTAKIETLETKVERLEDEAYTELLDLHKEANQLEFEIDRLESDLKEVKNEIADIEDQLAQRDDLQQQRDEIQEELTDLRTRIDQLEIQATEEFNEHMETVLDLLEYKNIERIWLERKKSQVQEGRRKVEKTVFDLHVIRSTDSGATYEDTVTNLSESEREVTGVVFALAGYLTHALYETVPFMLLDSLEALDSERIATLVDYIREYTPYLVVALLPEDAAALDDDYTYITEI